VRRGSRDILLTQEDEALKELEADSDYEEQKRFWPKDAAHFEFYDLFELMISERTKRKKI